MTRRVHPQEPEAEALPALIAIYTRYSHENFQDSDSTNSQIDTCTDGSREQGWLYSHDLIFSDEGISGTALGPRTEMNRLLSLVEGGKATFKGVVIDSTSRFARSVGDVSTMVKLLRYHGIFLYFVDRKLHSDDDNFDEIVQQLAQKDEQFIRDLSHNVVRGHKTAVKKHMTHGGFYYGYRGEAIPDPTRRGTASRPALKGVELKKYEPEVKVISQIFAWADRDRLSLQRIANKCIESGFSRPYRQNGAELTWNADTIAAILHNPLYKGLYIYGRTSTIHHPRTGAIRNVIQPESKWTIDERPELAIVSKEQWDRVQQIIAERDLFGLARAGAVARRNNATDNPPLFSGRLKCGGCPGPINVVGKWKGERILGCKNHRQRRNGGCTNSIGIAESVLEKYLVSHIVDHLLHPDALEHAVTTVHSKLREEIASSAKVRKDAESRNHEIEREVRALKNQLRNLIDSLRQIGPDEDLKAEYARVKSRLQVISADPADSSRALEPVSLEQARDFVFQSCKDLTALLLSNRIVAQETLRSFVSTVVLTPTTLNKLPAYRVTGTLKPIQSRP